MVEDPTHWEIMGIIRVPYIFISTRMDKALGFLFK